MSSAMVTIEVFNLSLVSFSSVFFFFWLSSSLIKISKENFGKTFKVFLQSNFKKIHIVADKTLVFGVWRTNCFFSFDQKGKLHLIVLEHLSKTNLRLPAHFFLCSPVWKKRIGQFWLTSISPSRKGVLLKGVFPLLLSCCKQPPTFQKQILSNSSFFVRVSIKMFWEISFFSSTCLLFG